MPGSTPIRLAIVAAALAATVAGYRWWTSPERQIHAILGDVASSLSHEGPESELRALTAVAALQLHLAPEVTVDAGAPAGPVRGRQQVVPLAARLRASTPVMRVQVFDADITVSSDSAATARATVQVTTHDETGQEVAASHQVSMAFARSEGRWQVTSARILHDEEPSS